MSKGSSVKITMVAGGGDIWPYLPYGWAEIWFFGLESQEYLQQLMWEPGSRVVLVTI